MGVLGIIISILVIILIIMFLFYIFRDPYKLSNLQNGQNSATIKATSLATNGSNAPSSNFAYSIWFYINDFNYRYYPKYLPINRILTYYNPVLPSQQDYQIGERR